MLHCLVLSKYELAIPARALLLLNSLYLALCCVSLVLVSCSMVPSWPILSGLVFFVLSCVLRYVLLEEKTRMYERTMDMQFFHIKA